MPDQNLIGGGGICNALAAGGGGGGLGGIWDRMGQRRTERFGPGFDAANFLTLFSGNPSKANFPFLEKVVST